MATFLANGSDILNNPQVNSNSTGGQDNAGTIEVLNGTQPFASDALIRFTADPVTADGELTGASGFSLIEVFASPEDLAANNPLFVYDPQNPGQTANVQDSVDGIGDEYIRFNANVLTSSDPDAPVLSNIFVAPGSNAAENGGSFERNTDIDFNDDGQINNTVPEDGNGFFNVNSGVSANGPAICFLEGTMLKTPNGEVAIEALRPGDLIEDHEGAALEILYVQQRHHRVDEMNYLVRIEQGALGAIRPLSLSADHGLYAQAGISTDSVRKPCLVRSDALVGVEGVTRVRDDSHTVSFWNVMCARHALIRVHGVLCETMRPRNAKKLPHETAGNFWIHRAILSKEIDGTVVAPGVAPILRRMFEADRGASRLSAKPILQINGIDHVIDPSAFARRFETHAAVGRRTSS